MRVPFWVSNITPEDQEAVQRSLNSGYLTRGPEVEAFEAELCAISGARYAVCVSSGTAALMVAYRACWVGPECLASERRPAGGDYGEITVPALTFRGTALAALMLGAKVHYSDIGTGKPRIGIDVALTLGGDPRHATVAFNVLDAAHGPYTVSGGTALHCLSFDYQKHVRCGEGGAILTNHLESAEECRVIRDQGERGANFRMSEMHAALGRSQLRRLPGTIAKRRAIAARYDHVLEHWSVRHSPESWRLLYQLRVSNRDEMREALECAGIETRIHYPLCPGADPERVPLAAAHARETLSLPLYPELTEDQVDYVIETTLGAIREC